MSSLELEVEGRAPLGAVVDALQGWLTTSAPVIESHERIYYDTFDGRLHARGLVLSHQRHRLLLEPLDLTESAEGVGSTQAPMPAEPQSPFLCSALPEGKLQSRVARATKERALLVLARVRVRTESLAVLDEREKTIVRILCEEAELVGGRHDGRGLTPRVRITGLRGYERELERATELLVAAEGFAPASLTLVDEAARAYGRDPAGVSTRVRVAMEREAPAAEAVTQVLAELLALLDATLPGTINGTDVEFLHDYRVTVRRMRSVLREFARVFDPARLMPVASELRWLQEITGETRDLDVYVDEFDELRGLAPETLAPDYEPLEAVVAERRGNARAAMVRELQSPRASLLRQRLGDLSENPGGGEFATRPIAKLTADRIRHVHHRMIKMGGAITPDSPPQDYHDLRKRGKELRYLLELFGEPLFDTDVVKPLIRSLKSLQDVLGRHQDREVQISRLRSLAADVARREGGVEALLAMGVLIDRLDTDAARARERFAEVFEDFGSAEQRKLVRWTFREHGAEDDS